jgi:uncharacterized protein YecT (DUF1311 family)
VGELADWIHLDAIQALVHHASAVVVAIFLFGLTARLITYLIPDGHAKKLVIIIDDAILLAVFALAGYRLLNYMWVKPHGEGGPGEPVELVQAHAEEERDANTGVTLAKCMALTGTSNQLGQCLERKLVQAEAGLNQSSERMLADMKVLDQAGSGKIGAREGFETAQRAFIQYREDECKWRSATAADAKAEDVYKACMADMANARTKRIETLLK